jgi:predicted metalloendopeptidase
VVHYEDKKKFRIINQWLVFEKLTLGENLADNGGVLIAFNAWRNSLANATVGRPKSEQTLPGLEQFTPEQLFFINFGRIWCQNIRPEKSVNRVSVQCDEIMYAFRTLTFYPIDLYRSAFAKQMAR